MSALETLTDEELAVLSPGPSVAVTPYLTQLAPGDREAVLRTALRGLVARGLAEPPDGDSPELRVRADLVHVVTLRRAAAAVVALARSTAEHTDHVYLHVVDDVLLVEQVDGAGLHRFSLRPLADLVPLVTDAAVHPDAGDAHGPAADLVPDGLAPPGPVLEAAGAALLHCDLLVLTPGEEHPVLSGLFSAPAGSWLFRSVRGSGGPVSVAPVTAGALRAHVAERLAAVAAVAV